MLATPLSLARLRRLLYTDNRGKGSVPKLSTSIALTHPWLFVICLPETLQHVQVTADGLEGYSVYTFEVPSSTVGLSKAPSL